MPRLPLGRRRWPDVWRRQVRWGSTRLNLPRGEGRWCCSSRRSAGSPSGLAGGVALVAYGVGMGYLALAVALHTRGVVRGRGLVPRRPRPAVRTARLGGGAGARGAGAGCWLHRRGADATESTGAAPTSAAGWRPRGWRRRKERMRMTNAMEDIATVMLPERVDSATSASVEALMFAALRPGARVIVDGSAVTYMSAAGVRVLATRHASGGGAGYAHRVLPLQRPGGRLSAGQRLLPALRRRRYRSRRPRKGCVPISWVTAADRLHPRGAAG